MVTENTVEEKIVERAQQKLKLDAMVVQSGRLKEKDKVSKDDIMNAVRFGADAVFRSEESSITDDDIDAILERGRAKTKEMTDKIQKAEKGDLLDFRMDGGISAQTFEGVDYSDKALRDQLKLLAAESIGKRERKPLTSYNPILAPKKSMIVNNTKIKLPKSLRLPRMEDHQFYNRDRLLELADMEFQTYAALREMGQLPSKEYIERARTLLPPEYAEEKLALLNEGFGQFSRSQYFHFGKACAKFGKDDIASISADMDLPVELVAAYGKAFWKFGPTELPEKEWERVKNSVEKGEAKIARRKKQSVLLEKFVNTFDDPRRDMTFANKGTVHFALEQDRALLCAVDKRGYGNWEEVREEIIHDPALQFSHTVQALSIDLITKRCDYRIRQMEKEVEAREKKMRLEKPLAVAAAETAVAAIKEMESWEAKSLFRQIQGDDAPPMDDLSAEAKTILEDRLRDKEIVVDRLRELDVQVRGCLDLAEETKQGIMRGDQVSCGCGVLLRAADFLLITSCLSFGSNSM
jgi:SWI/SNF-related matrix-associated actin-dependent regulator of chromatin subfamily A member 5